MKPTIDHTDTRKAKRGIKKGIYSRQLVSGDKEEIIRVRAVRWECFCRAWEREDGRIHFGQ